MPTEPEAVGQPGPLSLVMGHRSVCSASIDVWLRRAAFAHQQIEIAALVGLQHML